MTSRIFLRCLAFVLLALPAAQGQSYALPNQTVGDRQLRDYFTQETARLSDACLSDIHSAADWQARVPEYRSQLQEMLGLWPWPVRTDLKPVVMGTLERSGVVVERLHFQSLPGLYVTANLYRPASVPQPLPAILYVCGHALVKSNGVSYGNKTAYQHHGLWFAQHGYVCLLIDTLQLGEIEGLHHGTYREGLWWWNSRGYTPAGIEAWNSIRALDYLETRPEVDRTRFGMTGRSGGGSYTWTTAALDERIRAAAPVAGITDLKNQVVDGCVEGHCDCMFFVNKYRWDFALNAALIAPRPLLFVNTDRDTIFPLDGVVRTHAKVQQVYAYLGASTNLGLVIGPGPHQDTQDLQVPVFRWFNQHLRHADPLIRVPAERAFTPQELAVFPPGQLPSDQRNTRIYETFPAWPSVEPAANREAYRDRLREGPFRGWPNEEAVPSLELAATLLRAGVRFQHFTCTTQPGVSLPLFVAQPEGVKPSNERRFEVLDEKRWPGWAAALQAWSGGELKLSEPAATSPGSAADAEVERLLRRVGQGELTVAWFAPRGVGPSAWTQDPRKLIQIRRRFMLLGQTLDGMRVYDVQQAVRAWRTVLPGGAGEVLAARESMGVNALYAALFLTPAPRLDLVELPESHRTGPDYLGVLRVGDLGEAARWGRSGL